MLLANIHMYNEQSPFFGFIFTSKSSHQIANITIVGRMVVHKIKYRKVLLTAMEMILILVLWSNKFHLWNLETSNFGFGFTQVGGSVGRASQGPTGFLIFCREANNQSVRWSFFFFSYHKYCKKHTKTVRIVSTFTWRQIWISADTNSKKKAYVFNDANATTPPSGIWSTSKFIKEIYVKYEKGRNEIGERRIG